MLKHRNSFSSVEVEFPNNCKIKRGSPVPNWLLCSKNLSCMCEQLRQDTICLWGHPLFALLSLFKSKCWEAAYNCCWNEMKYSVTNERKKWLARSIQLGLWKRKSSPHFRATLGWIFSSHNCEELRNVCLIYSRTGRRAIVKGCWQLRIGVAKWYFNKKKKCFCTSESSFVSAVAFLRPHSWTISGFGLVTFV